MIPTFDHIVIGLSHADLQSPPSWLADNFTITPGGRHASGLTENKLIVFRDGTYIELIAFVNDDPEKNKGHWWADHASGYIDYVISSESADDVAAVNERLESADTGLQRARYAPSQTGGRTKPDGTEIKWQVTFPENVRRGELPFWCHDVTARELRVPRDISATTHDCHAVGVGQVTMLVPEAESRAFQASYSAVVGNEGVEDGHLLEWELHAPLKVSGSWGPVVVLKAPRTRAEEEKVKAGYAVIDDIALVTDSSGTGQSRDAIGGVLGGEQLRIRFLHGGEA